jgi:uncharacterized membrane protein YdjX (TVP38/TMEM64 family)
VLAAVGVVSAVALAWWVTSSHHIDLFHVAAWLESIARGLKLRAHAMGAWGPILLVVLLAVHSVVFFFPMEIPTFAAFSLYGPFLGVAIVWVGSMLAAGVSYLLGRLIGPPILRHFAKNRRVTTTAHVVGSLPSVELVLLRWISLIPYDALNLIFGTCEIPVWRFIWTTGLGVGVTNVAMVILYDRALHADWGQVLLIASIITLAIVVALHRGRALRERLKPK